VAFGATSQGIGWKFVISSESVFLAIFASLTIGLVFGVFPAMTASKLDPVEALRKGR
jgi:putative ABC transport system permease protein